MQNDQGEAPPSVFVLLFMIAVSVGITGAVLAWSGDVTTGEITCGEALAAGGLALWAATWV